MDVSGASFQNQIMLNSPLSMRNPQGDFPTAYDDGEFENIENNRNGSPVSQYMSAEAYKHPKERRQNIAGFKYDNKLSDKDHAIYYHPYKKHKVLATAGTHSAADIGTDIALTGHLLSQTRRYNNAKTKYRDMDKKYDGKSYVVGHSLGSRISDLLHSKHRSIYGSIGFNGPGAIFDPLTSVTRHIYQTPKQKRLNTHSVQYVHAYDPVSTFFGRSKRHIVKSHKFRKNPHNLDHWRSHFGDNS